MKILKTISEGYLLAWFFLACTIGYCFIDNKPYIEEKGSIWWFILALTWSVYATYKNIKKNS